MDTKVILYSVQCYALHWTDNNVGHKDTVKNSFFVSAYVARTTRYGIVTAAYVYYCDHDVIVTHYA